MSEASLPDTESPTTFYTPEEKAELLEVHLKFLTDVWGSPRNLILAPDALNGNDSPSSQQPQFFSWLAAISPSNHKNAGRCQQFPIKYPNQLKSALNRIYDNYFPRENIYFCVNLTNSREGRRIEYIEYSKVIWADLDDKMYYGKLLVPPTYLIRTSAHKTNKYQAVWILDEHVSSHLTSRISYRIACHHNLDHVHDPARLLRLPLSGNFKYSSKDDTGQTAPFQVEIIQHTPSLYRPGDFKQYKEPPAPKFIAYNPQTRTEILTPKTDVPRYNDLDPFERARIDNYTKGAILHELEKLELVAQLKLGERMTYHGQKNPDGQYGWEKTAMWVARALTEIANAPWNAYSLQDAYNDFITNAPTDQNWTKNDNHDKWLGAEQKNCARTVRFRTYPQKWGV